MEVSNCGVGVEMPRYKSHKVVDALKIAKIEKIVDPENPLADSLGQVVVITPADEGYAPFPVSAEYVHKHDPQPGGYFVVYGGDGYQSFSPAQAFEEGYTRITGSEPVPDANPAPDERRPVDFTRATEATPEVCAAIEDAFEYHAWDEQKTIAGRGVRTALAHAVKVIVANVPPGPDRTVAIRKIREARMDCNSSITHNGRY